MKVTVQIFQRWIHENKEVIHQLIIDHEKQTRIFEEFQNWADGAKERSISITSFLTLFKAYAKNVAVAPLPKKSVGGVSISAKEKFAMLEKFVWLLHKGVSIKSLIVYGGPGSGKSTTVINTLNKLNQGSNKKGYVLFSGGVKGTYELAKILYENRKDKIIVFDDFDSAFRTKNQVNLLKTALQDDGETKYISYVDTTKKAKKDKIPSRFEFNSRIIFITNKLRIDPAIKSRSKIIGIDLSHEEMLERIKSVLPNFLPKVPLRYKEEVYSFLKKNLKKIKSIDFRGFKFTVANYLIDKEDNITTGRWQKWSLSELCS